MIDWQMVAVTPMRLLHLIAPVIVTPDLLLLLLLLLILHIMIVLPMATPLILNVMDCKDNNTGKAAHQSL